MPSFDTLSWVVRLKTVSWWSGPLRNRSSRQKESCHLMFSHPPTLIAPQNIPNWMLFVRIPKPEVQRCSMFMIHDFSWFFIGENYWIGHVSTWGVLTCIHLISDRPLVGNSCSHNPEKKDLRRIETKNWDPTKFPKEKIKSFPNISTVHPDHSQFCTS